MTDKEKFKPYQPKSITVHNNPHIEIDWRTLGGELAALDDKTQAAFFGGMALDFASWGGGGAAQMQMLHAADLLSPGAKKILSETLPALWEGGEE